MLDLKPGVAMLFETWQRIDAASDALEETDDDAAFEMYEAAVAIQRGIIEYFDVQTVGDVLDLPVSGPDSTESEYLKREALLWLIQRSIVFCGNIGETIRYSDEIHMNDGIVAALRSAADTVRKFEGAELADWIDATFPYQESAA